MQKHLLAPAISIQNAYLAYQHSIIFENLNLTLPSGKWTSILGPSGVGKSTFLRLIANLSAANTVMHASVNADNATPLHYQIAYMAQTDLLLPWLNVLDNVLLTIRLRAHTANEKKRLVDQAKTLLARAGLEKVADLFPRHLSGGMRQRVALVRTLIEDKMVVLMDEPFSALDAITRIHLQDLAIELLKDRTVLFITHDPLEALRISDEIIVMSGQPAILSKPLILAGHTPRDLTESDLVILQKNLYSTLHAAHAEMS